jgi:hypothetical protein
MQGEGSFKHPSTVDEQLIPNLSAQIGCGMNWLLRSNGSDRRLTGVLIALTFNPSKGTF